MKFSKRLVVLVGLCVVCSGLVFSNLSGQTPTPTPGTVLTIPGEIGIGGNVPPAGYQGDGTGISQYVACGGTLTGGANPYYLVWGAAAGASEYQIQGVVNGSLILNNPVAANASWAVRVGGAAPDLPDGIYYVRVRARNASGIPSVADGIWADTTTWGNLGNGVNGSWCRFTLNTAGVPTATPTAAPAVTPTLTPLPMPTSTPTPPPASALIIPGQLGLGGNQPPFGYQGDGIGISQYVPCGGTPTAGMSSAYLVWGWLPAPRTISFRWCSTAAWC